MILITSWNEWNEDTAIEPVKYSHSTDTDDSKTGKNFTKGYIYNGFDTKYLEIISDKVVAVRGRVMNKNKRPLKGLEIIARQGSYEAIVRTDSFGFYRISRLNLTTGSCELMIKDTNKKREIKILRDKTTKGINFILD